MNPKLKLVPTMIASALSLAGCYVVPVVDSAGNVQYQHLPLPPAGTPVVVAPAPAAPAPAAPPAYPAAYPAGNSTMPVILNARLYPDNELATRGGVVTGTVANMMNGKGRFPLQYGAEVLTGEATRVSNDERKGIASAYGSSGAFMSCEYQMSGPQQGAGTCSFSNGARYKLHIGS